MYVADAEAIKILSGYDSLLDAKLMSLGIYEDKNYVSVRIVIMARPSSKYSRVTLTFKDVVDFCFSYAKEYTFGNIEDLRFEVTEDGEFYISLDPDFSEPNKSTGDMDYVRSKNLFVELESK
ncbi:hypothetical protein [Solimonas marina]|uniref:Uncharacterized protein n=1 Tax=Solimonas marina TaxID=2714601 RepID=A0A970B6D5_9GAMM|nr:hypothetical protein [Solimonas marina]NKF22673.1 hypothetical protein [Solimonas marina]